MWNEIECLAGCLRAISHGTLTVAPRSPESNELQHYINGAVKRIKRLGTNSSKIVGRDIYDIGYAVFETFNGQDIDRLQKALDVLEFRRNIIRAVTDLGNGNTPNTIIIAQEVHVGNDTYNFGNGSQLNQVHQGATADIRGPDNRTQTQINNNSLSELSVELERLVLEAIKSGKLTLDGSTHESAKELVLEAKKPVPDATKVLGALGTIEGALGHVSGIGDKIHSIAEAIKTLF